MREILYQQIQKERYQQRDKVKPTKRRAGKSKHQTGREKVKDTHKVQTMAMGTTI